MIAIIGPQASPAWALEIPPDRIGRGGEAWRVSLDGVEHAVPDTTATLALWFLRSPLAHPFWSWWVVSAIHLRPIAGVKPAAIREPGATHEILVVALHPDSPPPQPRGMRAPPALRFLTPIDVQQQFVAIDDRGAVLLCERLVDACCAGRLSPDQDYRSAWREVIAFMSEAPK